MQQQQQRVELASGHSLGSPRLSSFPPPPSLQFNPVQCLLAISLVGLPAGRHWVATAATLAPLPPQPQPQPHQHPRAAASAGAAGGGGTETPVPLGHSCIHDEILAQRRRSGRPEYSVSPQVYEEVVREWASGAAEVRVAGRELLAEPAPEPAAAAEARHKPIRIFLNYDAIGLSPDRDCRAVNNVVKLGEPPLPLSSSSLAAIGLPVCSATSEPPVLGDCWYNCTAEDVADAGKQHRLHEALAETAAWFRSALMVEPVRGPLRLSGYSACGQDGGVQLPRRYIDEGVRDADLVLLVTTRPTTGNTLAWAVACERDQWGRAIAGHVNVAPRHLTAEAETLLSATLIHEVMHVLGFDPHAFAHFRDERKRRRTEVVVQSFDEELGRPVTRVVLPRVVATARQHYGAFTSSFAGLELEDGGGRGTAGSHWEKRLLMNEIMTGSVDTRSVVSAMTLALLEDSGWYVADYTRAELLGWGRGQGPDFAQRRCDAWTGAYRCNSTHASGCTYNREAEGYCPIVQYSGDLPDWARYFGEPNRGGQSSLADYCAFFVAYSDGSCIDASSARAPDRMLGEMRGPDSRCMSSSLVRTGFVRGMLGQGNGCYQHRCRNHTLEVAVDGRWRKCPAGGGPVTFSGFHGELVCPPYYELCADGSPVLPGQCAGGCSRNGHCIDGACCCFIGFAGDNCSERVCPGNCSNRGRCSAGGLCECYPGYTGIDCSTAGCDEQCSLHGGVCDNGVCEFRCSDYAGYTCQNTSGLVASLALCSDVLATGSVLPGFATQHCAPSESSILQQLEAAVVLPNYNRLLPGGRSLLGFLDDGHCASAAKRLACWISIQQCDQDGDNRLRVCHSACASYNAGCGARLDCSDRTLFSGGGALDAACTGGGTVRSRWPWWRRHAFLHATLAWMALAVVAGCFAAVAWHSLHSSSQRALPRSCHPVPSLITAALISPSSLPSPSPFLPFPLLSFSTILGFWHLPRPLLEGEGSLCRGSPAAAPWPLLGSAPPELVVSPAPAADPAPARCWDVPPALPPPPTSPLDACSSHD
eukprot:SM000030S11394  [mRNA]  locus=s30:428293:434659:- [translate_table: standard]